MSLDTLRRDLAHAAQTRIGGRGTAYLLGSSSLGDVTGARTAIILLVVPDDTSDDDAEAFARTCVAFAKTHDLGASIVVVSASAAATPAAPWPLWGRIDVARRSRRREPFRHDAGDGDPGLVLEYAVAAQVGPVDAHAGPRVGPVDPDAIRDRLREDLEHSIEFDDETALVITANRAAGFLEGAGLFSVQAAADLAAARYPSYAGVIAAAARAHHDAGAATPVGDLPGVPGYSYAAEVLDDLIWSA